MKKPSKKSIKKQIKKELAHDAAKLVRKKAKKRLHHHLGKLAFFGLMTFVVTFGIYMFNLENKLIYYVIRPFLNNHYDAQKRDRRIV